MNIKRDFVLKIGNSMQNEPLAWVFDEYTVENTKGLSIWIANIPILDIGIFEPTKISLNIFEKFYLYKKIKQLKTLKIKEILGRKMKEYHKIQTMFKRNKENHQIIIGEWTLPEFEYLQNNEWVFTEKVDGTNIRVMFDGVNIKYGGKTDNAQLNGDLIQRLRDLFDSKIDIIKEKFPIELNSEKGLCFYGEGYGAGIQKGGIYKPTKDFVLFDIKIGNLWIDREGIENIAKTLNIDIVPIVGKGTLQYGIDMVKNGLKSAWGDFIAEGIVARPSTELKTKHGERIITKIKHRDFFESK